MHSMAGGRVLQACLVIVYRYRSVKFKQGIVVHVVFSEGRSWRQTHARESVVGL